MDYYIEELAKQLQMSRESLRAYLIRNNVTTYLVKGIKGHKLMIKNDKTLKRFIKKYKAKKKIKKYFLLPNGMIYKYNIISKAITAELNGAYKVINEKQLKQYEEKQNEKADNSSRKKVS